MFPDITMMSVIGAATAPRIATTTTATFRKLAALDCVGASNTTLQNGGDGTRKISAIVIIMAIAAGSKYAEMIRVSWV